MILIRRENMFSWQIFHVRVHKHLQTLIQSGFGVHSCQVPRGVHLWVVLLNQRIIENAVPHFPCLSQTPCLWGDVHQSLWSKIIVRRHWSSQSRQHKSGTPWVSLEHVCPPSFLLSSRGVVCFPFPHAATHYLIGRHWLAANWIGCRYSSSVMIVPI